MVNMPHSPHTADIFVLNEVNEHKLIVVIRSNILFYVRRVFKSDHFFSLQLIVFAGSGKKTWLAALISDFNWMKTVFEHKLSELPCLEHDLHYWIKFTAYSSWRNFVQCDNEQYNVFVRV